MGVKMLPDLWQQIIKKQEFTESQLDVSRLWGSVSNNNAFGQRLTIANRTVKKLSFYLKRTGSPSGTVTFLIRSLADSILATKLWGNSVSIGTTAAWYEVAFGSPILINEEVYILIACTNTVGGANYVQVYDSEDDVKANEYMVRRAVTGVYTNYVNQDFGYIYTYVN